MVSGDRRLWSFRTSADIRPVRGTIGAFGVVLQLDALHGFNEPRISSLVSVLVQGQLPVILVVDPVNETLVGNRKREGGGELQTQGALMMQEFAGGSGAVGADQEPRGVRVSLLVVRGIRAVGQRIVEDSDVISRRIDTLITGPEHGGPDFPGAVLSAVIDDRDDGFEPVPAFEPVLMPLECGRSGGWRRCPE